MALNLSSMLLQLSPTAGIDFGSGAGGGATARQQLALQREQFEEVKRQNALRNQQEKEAAAALASQNAAKAEADKAEKQAVIDAELENDRLAAEAKFGEHVAAGDPEAAEALMPMMQNLGQGVDITRSATGMPSYRIHHDAAKDKATEIAETNQNWEQATPQERPIFKNPLDEAETQPLNQLRPGSPGGAVLDMQVLADQRAQRLNPALRSFAESLPTQEERESAQRTATGVQSLGLPVDKGLTEYRNQQGIVSDRMDAKSKQVQQKELSASDKIAMRRFGTERLNELAKERNISGIVTANAKAKEALTVLDDDNRENDTMVAGAIMDAQGVKGVPSNTDLEYALGIEKGSLLTKGLSWLEEKVRGGMSTAQKNAIKKYLEAAEKTQTQTLDDFYNNAFDRIDGGRLEEEELRGYRDALEQAAPRWAYNEYWERRDAREAEDKRLGRTPSRPSAQAAPAPGKANEELQRQAEGAGLNGSVLGQLMSGESGGDPNAANDKSSAKGVFQVIDGTAKGLGFKDAADYASQSVEKQIEAGLKLFKNKGLTKDSPPEDYALTLAAPSLVGKWKSRDDVVYKKDSDEWKANAPWHPADGGDITVGSIADYYFKGKGGAEKPKAAPQPKSDADRRALELLGGG